MLEGAVRLYNRLTVEQLFRGLNPGAVAAEAGYTRSYFYVFWKDQASFWADLAEHLTNTGLRSDEPVVVSDASYLPGITEGKNAREVIRETQLRDFYAIDNDDFRLRMGMVSKAVSGSDLARLIAESQKSWLLQIVPIAEAGLAAWDREPRPPFDVEKLLATIVSLLDGFAFRRVVDPAAVTDEMVTEAVLVLTMDLTRPIGDSSTVDDLTAPIDTYPHRRPASDGRYDAQSG